MLPRLATTSVLCLALLLPACGDGEEETPSACLGGDVVFLRALESAPAQPVSLEEGVPISSCLVENQPVGELSDLGTALVSAATRLGTEAQTDPKAATELGYLVGSVQSGAEETGGIHTDLVRRLESAAELRSDGKPDADIEQAYADGLAAGRESG